MFKFYLKIADLTIEINMPSNPGYLKELEEFRINKIDSKCDIRYIIQDISGFVKETLHKSILLYEDTKIAYYKLKSDYYRLIKFIENTVVRFDPGNPFEFEVYTNLNHEEGVLPIKELLCFDLPLLEREGVQLHAALVKYKDRGIMFSAPSGTGKSTQANLWQEKMDCEIINGDKAILRIINDGISAYGSPWAGTSQIYRSEKAKDPVIFIIRQSNENKIVSITAKTAVALLLSETQAQCWRNQSANKICRLLEEIVKRCPVNILECRPDAGAVEIVNQFMLKH